MGHTPFTLEEATDIAEDFEDLIDTDFKVDKSVVYEVNNVLVCPYNDDDKQKFADNYHRTKDKEGSLHFYAGNEFDIIVFAYNIADATGYQYIDIMAFAEQMGISYRYPGEA